MRHFFFVVLFVISVAGCASEPAKWCPVDTCNGSPEPGSIAIGVCTDEHRADWTDDDSDTGEEEDQTTSDDQGGAEGSDTCTDSNGATDYEDTGIVGTEDTAGSDVQWPTDDTGSQDDTEHETAGSADTASDSAWGTGGEDTASATTDTGQWGTGDEDTASHATDTGQEDTDPYQPWEPDIKDTSGYWAAYYPDTVEIFRNDTDQYMRGDFIDEDGDGFAWEVDCNDRNNTVYPGRMESESNGIDDNCNCKTDEEPTDFAPTDDCPKDWWDHNFSKTRHQEWALPKGASQEANSPQMAEGICYGLGHSWRPPSLAEAQALYMKKMGVDGATGEPSDAKGSCWCDFPWTPDPCGQPFWVGKYMDYNYIEGVARCDAYIENIADPSGGYMTPAVQVYPANQFSGYMSVICTRSMPNGI